MSLAASRKRVGGAAILTIVLALLIAIMSSRKSEDA